MRFRVEPCFVHRNQEPRYFVRPLSEHVDDGWRCGYRWEIQLLNDDGQGVATIEFGPADGTEFGRFLGIHIPESVIAAAMSGISDYVDADGRRRLPSFLGGGVA